VATIIAPDSLAPARGYSNGLLFERGRILFVSGQVGWDREKRFVSNELVGQFAQSLDNVLAVVREAGGAPEHIGRLTVYVTDKRLYNANVKAIGAAYRERMGKHYPAMALVEVKALLEDEALCEIEATAVVP
jgi:enamine deaminase RidA (YjgF/YER057c/UK114 family)